jgi:hypothetical protein
MAAQALRTLLKSTESVPTTLIDPAASLLRSQHIQVQYEGYELLRELIKRPNCQDQIIVLLVATLKTVFESIIPEENHQKEAKSSGNWSGVNVEEQKEREKIMSGYIQQAFACKLVGVLLASDRVLAEKLVRAQVVSALLNVVGNVGHHDSQKYAVSNILFLVHSFEEVSKSIKKMMGDNFYDLLEVSTS